MNNRTRFALLLLVISLAVAAALLGACSPGQQPDIPSEHPLPCATWQAPDGTWMEEDNEPVDDDPCDRRPDSKKSPSVKPSVKKPVATTKAPAPRVTRR